MVATFTCFMQGFVDIHVERFGVIPIVFFCVFDDARWAEGHQAGL